MKRYGWFEYEQNPQITRNYLTGQSLTIQSSFIDGQKEFFQGIYSDKEISHPVQFYMGRGERNHLFIFLDYNKIITSIQSYGFWRRIDDFMIDALLCWPDFLTQPSAFILYVQGRWQANGWNSELIRQFSSRKAGSPEQIQHYPIAESYLIPLDTPAPLNWKLVDVVSSATKINLQYGEHFEADIPYLPRSKCLDGFDGIVPYLMREDGKAYIIFTELEPQSFRGEEPETWLYYTYIDENLFFTFRSHPEYKNELGTVKNFGFRESPPRPELLTITPMGEPISYEKLCTHYANTKSVGLSYPVWLSTMHTLGEAWFAWKKPRQKIEIDNNRKLSPNVGRTGYVGDYGATISHGFNAGIVNSWFEVRFLDHPPKLEPSVSKKKSFWEKLFNLN